MFNAAPFNLQYFNESQPVYVEALVGEIIYNGYVLHQTEDIRCSFTNHHDGPRVEAKNYLLPGTDWGVLESYLFRERTVVFRGSMSKGSMQELIDEMEYMKKLLCIPDQILQVYIGSEPLRARAYLKNPDNIFPREYYNIDWQPFTLEFVVLSPFWESVGLSSKTYWISTSLTEEVYNLWSAKTKPKVTLVFSAASSTNSINFTMWNKSIVINRSISAGDIVIIDSENYEVSYNGVLIDFDGIFPEIWLNNNPYTIVINGTFTVTVTMQRKTKFI